MKFSKFDYPELSERQQVVFTALLHQYVTTARAVGSGTLSKRLDLNISPATIRNVMSDLEDLGMLSSPHTSAGRIPTTLGYGYYVDGLMQRVDIGRDDRQKINDALEEVAIGGVKELLDKAGEAIANTSTLISVILSPKMAEGILHSIDLHRISSGRLLIVLTIRNGFVRSILLEISSVLSDDEVKMAKRFLNQRLSGNTLEEIRQTILSRVSGTEEANSSIVKLVTESAEHIFRNDRDSQLHIDGTKNFLDHPEFTTSENMKGIIEILDDRDMILHMLQKGDHKTEDGVRIAIGEEIGKPSLKECSVLTTGYKVGRSEGALGIIGPKRMDYPRIASLINFAASAINERVE